MGEKKTKQEIQERVIELLLEKNNIMTEVAGIYFENDVRELSEEQKKRHKELHDRNSEILEELINLGYAKVGEGEGKKKEERKEE